MFLQLGASPFRQHSHRLTMDYATDRRDRRARGHEIDQIIQHAIRDGNHTELANALRDKGLNEAALHHYYLALDANWKTVGDYATMANLAGNTHMGVICLLAYRNGLTEWVSLGKIEGHTESTNECPCGDPRCGRGHDEVWKSERYSSIIHDIQLYIQSMPVAMPHSNEIWKGLQANSFVELPSCEHVPPSLRFWESRESFPIILQVLLVKLLYETLPPLAAEAVIRIPLSLVETTRKDYKSHHAYYVLIHAMILGKPMKIGRRMAQKYYHVPVWDLIFGTDRRRDIQYQGNEWLEYFRSEMILSCRPKISETGKLQPLVVIGDSHVLSMAFQTCCIAGRTRFLYPFVITGLKAWHCQPNFSFFTSRCLRETLNRLRVETIVISAGEIDCREGVGGELLEGYNQHSIEHIQNTVIVYLNSLQGYSQFQFLVLPVAPHAVTKKGRVKGQAFRRKTTQLWNQTLRECLPRQNLYYLDYCDDILDESGDYVLNPLFDADSTHMNSAFLPFFEKAVEESGCDLTRL